LHLSGYEVWQKITNDLQQVTISVSTTKMEETTTSKIRVEKEGVLSLQGVTTKTTALFRDTAMRTSNSTRGLTMR